MHVHACHCMSLHGAKEGQFGDKTIPKTLIEARMCHCFDAYIHVFIGKDMTAPQNIFGTIPMQIGARIGLLRAWECYFQVGKLGHEEVIK